MVNKNQHVLIIGFVWPEPRSSAAGSRMMQLLSLFQELGWKVTFASTAAESEYSANLERLGIDRVSIEVNNSSFDDFIKDLEPSIVIFDRFVTEEQFGWRVAEHCPNALRILDTEDLHSLRRTRKEALKDGRDFTEKDLLSAKDAKREVASIYRSDLSLIISEVEMELLTNLFGVDSQLLHYLPFLLDTIDEDTKRDWPSYESRKHFVTIGNFQHDPNMDSVIYLKQEIWPQITKQLPDAELHIYGSYVNQRAEQMHNPSEGFYIEGRAEEAKKVVKQAKVCLAPLRFGAGLKGKLVEAMQCGTPSVTTEIGAEGINGSFPWSGKIASDPQKFASAAVELFINKSAWGKAQEQGVRIINERFNRSKFENKFIDRLNEIQPDLENHRIGNFTGQMLMHHTMASAKYMSRWIEEKNS